MPKKHRFDLEIVILPIIAILTFLFLVVFQKDSDKRFDIEFKTVKNLGTKKQIEKTENSATIDWVETKTLFEETKKQIEGKSGTYGVYIKDIKTGVEFEYNQDNEFYGASLYKLPIAAATLKEIERGALKFETMVTYYPFDTTQGTGVLSEEKIGTKFSVKKLLRELIKSSDNTAQHMLLRTISQDQISTAFSKLTGDTHLNKFYNVAITNPLEFSNILEELYYGDFLLYSSREYLLELMYPTLFDDRISPHLGAGYIFRHKIGSWEGSWHDCGIVFSDDKEVLVCLMSKDTSYAEFIEVCELIGDFINGIF